MRLLLELMLVHVAYATSQPSLARVAAVLFLRVPYDDRDRIRSDMKRNSHTHHPLFRGWSNRRCICCSLFGLQGFPFGTAILNVASKSCQAVKLSRFCSSQSFRPSSVSCFIRTRKAPLGPQFRPPVFRALNSQLSTLHCPGSRSVPGTANSQLSTLNSSLRFVPEGPSPCQKT